MMSEEVKMLEPLDEALEMAGITNVSAIQKLENMLLVAVPRDLTDQDVLSLRRLVLENVRQYHSQWVLLDFSRVDICDSFFGRFIQSTAKMVALMGAEVIVAGLQDAVVETMVELGMTLPSVHSVLDLDDALALSREYSTTPPLESDEPASNDLLLDSNCSGYFC